ncbi:threonine synthase [Agriterribacter sp.]|mgnify:CR=1 FL=1|uniref:threonine synthase n=1 Tax=Agriterribacter sp. TaxID=2821509 RepID=UPI002C9E891B|nr:threonine synthase [Agriterribacter sp.]HRO45805.1 threonine synthase [Agriterribacter sp.]HRQ16740.1 threonine synthase [Agriterribacter sp.]
MKYYSLNQQSPKVSFKEATIKGQAPDKGLYFPESLPRLDKNWIAGINGKSNAALAFDVIQPYAGNDIPEDELRRIVAETVNFPSPLVQVNDHIFALELFHGPTLAFKDTGARFMSRCLGYFAKERSEKITVLVATSGDTGGAVAHGFYDVEGVDVVILYPSGKVSSVQEKQLTALGKNIHALEVNGTFDDCQRMVKQAFADESLTQKRVLTSANSINVARWLPQQFYYFFAYKQWSEKENPPVFCVPSGNFGNICAGMLAHISGLPAAHFIAACNANNVVPRYLHSGKYEVKEALPTLSNAMDVGDPSNFVRVLQLFGNNFINLKKMLSGYTITDAETKDTIKKVWEKTGYLTDPHGAVGYLSLQRYIAQHPGQKGIFLETAHPVKFYDVVEPLTGEKVPLPPSVERLLHLPKHSIVIDAAYPALKNYLLQH